MLMFDKAGGSGWANHCGIMILGTFTVPSSPQLMPKRAWPLSLSFSVGIPTLLPPLHSSSSAFLPALFWFGISLPQNNPIAPPQRINPSAPILIVLIIVSVVMLIVVHVFRGGSRTKMAFNNESWSISHTV